MSVSGDDIREQVLERHPELRPPDRSAAPVDRDSARVASWLLGAAALVMAGVLASRGSPYTPVSLAVAALWLLPRGFAAPIAAAASIASGAWLVVAQLLDASAGPRRAVELAVGVALLIAPVLALVHRRRA